MPLSIRVAGIDLSIGGPPLAAHISRLSSSQRGAANPSSVLLHVSDPSSTAPPGFSTNTLTRVVGNGRADWARARRALETADMLDLPWARFWRGGKGTRWASGDAVVVGARVLLPGLWVANVNRVVDVRRRRSEMSVAWATTARHVLVGEEVVRVQRVKGGDVVFSLKSYARPASLAGWITYPYIVYLQRKFARGICKRLQQITASESDDSS
jgi:uncharacterized protein (UPF0548 family)